MACKWKSCAFFDVTIAEWLFLLLMAMAKHRPRFFSGFLFVFASFSFFLYLSIATSASSYAQCARYSVAFVIKSVSHPSRIFVYFGWLHFLFIWFVGHHHMILFLFNAHRRIYCDLFFFFSSSFVCFVHLSLCHRYKLNTMIGGRKQKPSAHTEHITTLSIHGVKMQQILDDVLQITWYCFELTMNIIGWSTFLWTVCHCFYRLHDPESTSPKVNSKNDCNYQS